MLQIRIYLFVFTLLIILLGMIVEINVEIFLLTAQYLMI